MCNIMLEVQKLSESFTLYQLNGMANSPKDKCFKSGCISDNVGSVAICITKIIIILDVFLVVYIVL